VRPARPGTDETEATVIAVISIHMNLLENRIPSRQEMTFHACADEIFAMISLGSFPDLEAAPEPKRGAPRSKPVASPSRCGRFRFAADLSAPAPSCCVAT